MKLPQVSGKELIRKLQHAGFIAIRQQGSHVRMEKRITNKVKTHNSVARCVKERYFASYLENRGGSGG